MMESKLLLSRSCLTTIIIFELAQIPMALDGSFTRSDNTYAVNPHQCSHPHLRGIQVPIFLITQCIWYFTCHYLSQRHRPTLIEMAGMIE
jgi:hypothetical protein